MFQNDSIFDTITVNRSKVLILEHLPKKTGNYSTKLYAENCKTIFLLKIQKQMINFLYFFTMWKNKNIENKEYNLSKNSCTTLSNPLVCNSKRRPSSSLIFSNFDQLSLVWLTSTLMQFAQSVSKIWVKIQTNIHGVSKFLVISLIYIVPKPKSFI